MIKLTINSDMIKLTIKSCILTHGIKKGQQTKEKWYAKTTKTDYVKYDRIQADTLYCEC